MGDLALVCVVGFDHCEFLPMTVVSRPLVGEELIFNYGYSGSNK